MILDVDQNAVFLDLDGAELLIAQLSERIRQAAKLEEMALDPSLGPLLLSPVLGEA